MATGAISTFEAWNDETADPYDYISRPKSFGDFVKTTLKALFDPACTFLPKQEIDLENRLIQDEINQQSEPPILGPFSLYDIFDTLAIVGMVPNPGELASAKIKGFTGHDIDSTISHNGLGVTERAMLDAVKNPIKITPQPNGTIRYVGKDATAVLNRDGKVVTTWPNSSEGWRIK